MVQREHAQKAALEALRNASATENIVRIYKYVANYKCCFLVTILTLFGCAKLSVLTRV